MGSSHRCVYPWPRIHFIWSTYPWWSYEILLNWFRPPWIILEAVSWKIRRREQEKRARICPCLLQCWGANRMHCIWNQDRYHPLLVPNIDHFQCISIPKFPFLWVRLSPINYVVSILLVNMHLGNMNFDWILKRSSQNRIHNWINNLTKICRIQSSRHLRSTIDTYA